ncbi:MAG: Gfo/Idh/MocA family oxidoreductase [Planctomycetes bacterium]|nr:Gfo/Idh/MocA family oxidoreductase [Planctomycetota bacterium]
MNKDRPPLLELRLQDYMPGPPEKKDYGIGAVGCGNIARNAHQRAYANCGYRTVACYDIKREAAESMAKQYGIPTVCNSIEELCQHPDVQIIDLAVHANIRRKVMAQVVKAAGPQLLGIFSQKPFAMEFKDAVAMVKMCKKAKLPLMINQQARWAPNHRALKHVIDTGMLGHVYSIVHFHRSFQDNPNSWVSKLRNFNIVDHGCHYIDLLRHFSGKEPVRVKCTANMQPGQASVTPMCHTVLCEFKPSDKLAAMSHFNNIIRVGQMHGYEWFVDGTEGSATVDRGKLTVCFLSRPDYVQTVQLRGAWFPDAFGGSMGEMMRALNEKREPMTSGADNLKTIRIVEAAVISSKTGRAVDLKSIK